MLHQVTTWFHGIASIPNYGFTEFVEYSKYFKGRSIALWLLFVVRLSVCPCPNPPKYREMLVQLIPWTGRQTDIFQWVGLPVTVSSLKVLGWGDETNRKLQHIMRNQTIEKSIISIHADYTSSVKGNGSTKRIEAMVCYRDCPGFKNMFSHQFINDGISRCFSLCWVSAGLVERELTSADPPNTSTSQSVR